MPKYKYQNVCSCTDIEFTLRYENEEKIEDMYCPFCGAMMEDMPEDDESEYE